MTDKDTSASYELVDRLRNGEAKAYQLIVDLWHQRVFNFALRYSNDWDFAREVAQKTFIQVFEKIDQLQDPGKLRSWIYKIASNNCCNEGRIRSRVQYDAIDDQLASKAAPETPAFAYEKTELNMMVKDLLQRIPKEQREVVIMKEYEGLKFREIAEILGESENTVKSRMYYGLDAMRKILLSKNVSKDLYYE